jgi:hypothetical protein
MSGESVITTALRKSTNAWKVVIGTGTDYSATMDGIIGMMGPTIQPGSGFKE